MGLVGAPANAAPQAYTYCYNAICYESFNAAENAMRASGPVAALLKQSEAHMKSDGSVAISYRVPDQPPDVLGDAGYISGLLKPLGYECAPAMTPFPGTSAGCKSEQEAFDLDIAYLTSRNGDAGCYATGFHVTGGYDENPFNSIHVTPSGQAWVNFTSYSNPRELKYTYTCPGYLGERKVSYQKTQAFSCKVDFRPVFVTETMYEMKRRWPWKTYCRSDLAAEIQVRLLQSESCEANKNPCYPATGDKARFEPGFKFAGRDFEHVYHSVRQFPSRLFPAGWRFSFEERLQRMSDSSNQYAYVNSRGYVETFVFANNSATVGYSSSASGITLRRVPNDYNAHVKLVTQDGDVRSFDRHGYLAKIENSMDSRRNFRVTYFGESLSNDGRVASLIDVMGREVRFAYKSYDLLEAIYLPDGSVLAYQYDSGGNLAGITSAAGTRTYHYEGSVGLLTGITLQDGRRYATFGYDNSGRVTLSQLHTEGGVVEKTTLSYVGNNEISVVTPTGEVLQYHVFEGQARHVSGVSGLNGSKANAYDYSGRLMHTTDWRGVKTSYEYIDGFRSASSYAVGTSVQKREAYQYDSFGRLSARRLYDFSGSGSVLTRVYWKSYDENGFLSAKCQVSQNEATSVGYACGASATAPVGVRQTTYRHCSELDVTAGLCPQMGLLLSEDGPRTDVADIISYAYYSGDAPACAIDPTTCLYRKGDLWKVRDALGHVIETLAYDGAGRPLSVKDANGVITDFRYDARGHLTLRKVRGGSDAESRITRIAYWPTGLVKRVTQPDGSYTVYRYDTAQRLTGIDDNAGNRIRYTLDNAGNRIREDTRDPSGTLTRRLSRVHDELGRMQSQADAYGHATGYTYDASGNTTSTTDALGRQTANAYDPLNRLVATLQDVGGIEAQTQFTYDAQDNLTRVTDPKGLHTDYTYNGLGDLLQLSSPDTGVTQYTYDDAGNRTSQTDARGKTQTYAYDALNRLTQITGPSRKYLYDAGNASVCPAGERFNKGRLSGFNDPSGTTRYCYNRFGDLTQKVQTTNGLVFAVQYRYDSAGRLVSTTYPDGAVLDAVYDSNGQVAELGVTPNGGSRQIVLSGVTYAPFGPATGWQYGNGRILLRSLNRNYQPETIYDDAPGGLSLRYGFDEVGNLTLFRQADKNKKLAQYGYDGLNRLTQVMDGPTGTPIETYAYDATGNRTDLTNAGITTTYAYGSDSHRLDKMGNIARLYDAAGNTTKIGGNARQFVYDNSGRMTQVKFGGVITRQYGYNAKGEQTRAYLDAESAYFAYDEAGHLLGEYGGDGNPKQQFLWFGDLPVGVLRGAGPSQALHYVEPDHLGTPRAVIDGSRNVAIWEWKLTGEAFGATPPNQDPDQDGIGFAFDLRFPGQRYDAATGLNYNYFRHYDPTTGRYVESDPIGLSGGLSTFGYVYQSPFVNLDYFGLDCWVVTKTSHLPAIEQDVPVGDPFKIYIPLIKISFTPGPADMLPDFFTKRLDMPVGPELMAVGTIYRQKYIGEILHRVQDQIWEVCENSCGERTQKFIKYMDPRVSWREKIGEYTRWYRGDLNWLDGRGGPSIDLDLNP